MRPEVSALFREVADRSPEERLAYYAREQVPEALRVEVESLLEFDQAGDSLQGYVESAQKLLLDETTSQTQEHEIEIRPHTSGLPDLIGRFAVTKMLGRGGMGEVYQARDPLIDRMVAIKLIGSGLEGDHGRKRLMREARAAGRLHHSNIVTVFEAGEFEGRSFIAMEYVHGETLGSMIRRRAAITVRRRIELIEGACLGLAHAHRAGVIHLDIKPDNLMLDEAGVVKVLDFGISRVVQNETRTAQGAGTLRYMSPEQIQGTPLDHRSDVFSLGCSLFELVSYAPAFSGSTKEIVTQIAVGPIPSLMDVSPQFDRRLDQIIRRAMALEPSERYNDLEEMRAELARVRTSIDPASDVANGSALPATISTPDDVEADTPSRRAIRRHRAWSARVRIGIGLTIVAAAAAVALVVWNGRQPVDTTTVAPAAPTAPTSPPAVSSGTPAAAVAPPAVQPQDEVWRRLARGDRTGVIDWLTKGNADPALGRAVIDTVRSTTQRARDTAAATQGAAGTQKYRAADEQLARAERLAAAGRTLDSIRALWQATDLYAGSAISPSAPSVGATPQPSAPADQPAAATPPASTPAPVVAEAPPPTPTPASSTAVDRPVAPPTTPVETPTDQQSIARTLRAYDAAYKALDVGALQKVFPSLGRDQVDQLRRTFAGMSAYEMNTRITRVDVSGDTAVAQATVGRRMSPRVGIPIANDTPTEFRLQRSGSDWVIVNVRAVR